MYVGEFDPPLTPNEGGELTFDFTPDVPAGVTITSVVFTCSLISTDPGATADANPAGRLTGSPQIVTITDPVMGQRVLAIQSVSGAVDGNYYLLEALATLSAGTPKERSGHFRCRKAR